MRIICAICWGLAVPMFFVPEPIRNETNRIGAQLMKEEQEGVIFDHLADTDGDKVSPYQSLRHPNYERVCL